MSEDLLNRFVPDDSTMNQEIQPQVHVLLEGLTVYLSFAISSYTKPSSDFFTYVNTQKGVFCHIQFFGVPHTLFSFQKLFTDEHE